ncbi:MAG TPA: SDR family oxidoreductase [Acidobacteriaceae bacterium]|jgi:nucleoside-diphosphate-sugar epimerase
MSTFPSSVFVTGATGLLGNSLVRQMAARGWPVKALVRSRARGTAQFAGLPVEIVAGDMRDVAGFAQHLRGVDLLFHTAAFFRDGFKGGRHRTEMYEINVLGTRDLLSQAYSAGVRRFVHTSSATVLTGEPGAVIDETMLRSASGAPEYPESKILADAEVAKFLKDHRDASVSTVLPGWMIGPGDMGPTSAGQMVLDFLRHKLPGIPPSAMSVVDARDVAEAHIAAALHGRRGERYLVGGRRMEMAEIFALLEKITGVPAPKWKVPPPMLYALAALQEVWHFITRKPILISLAGARLMTQERERSRLDSSKAERELGTRFRPAEETLRDTVAWYRRNGWIEDGATAQKGLRTAGGSL